MSTRQIYINIFVNVHYQFVAALFVKDFNNSIDNEGSYKQYIPVKPAPNFVYFFITNIAYVSPEVTNGAAM